MQCQVEDTQLFDLVRDTIARWRSGDEPDAAGLLARHPALARHKSLAIDLIYEEYCLRHEAGDTLFRSTFCDRFPGYQQSLVRMLEVHDVLENRDGACREAAHWPQVGDSFQGYDLVDSLGRGSLARVFLAREPALGNRLVVVKISQDGAREAQLLGKLSHPAVVPIFSVKQDEQNGWTVICMPLLGTATATDLLDAAFAGGAPPARADVIPRVARQYRPLGVTLPSPEGEGRFSEEYADGIARLGMTLAEGIQAAHEAGIMHRDIKPSNVLLSWSGRPMLLDFNLSTDSNLVSQRVGGTLPYMAPELMRNLESGALGSRQLDPRADIFSLGALLYHLLTGQLPARPDNAEQLPISAIEPWLACRQRPVPPVRSFNPDVSPELEGMVLRCLALDPAGRYPTAGALASVLGNYLRPLARGRRAVRRHRRIVVTGMLGLAAAGITGAIYAATLDPYEVRLFAKGLAAYDRGDYKGAASTFRRCLEIDPHWAEAHFALGQTLVQQQDFAGARSAFTQLKARHPAVAGSMIGFCYLEESENTAALIDYSLAVHTGDRSPATLTNFAHCLRSGRELRRAIAAASEAIERDPSLPQAYYQRAASYLSLRVAGEELHPDAINDARKACELDDSSFTNHIVAATILAHLDEPPDDEIRSHLRRACELGYPPKPLHFDPVLRRWAPPLSTTNVVWPPREKSHARPSNSPVLRDFLVAVP